MTRVPRAATPTTSTGRFQIGIAILALACIAVHLAARYLLASWLPTTTPAVWNAPLFAALALGGLPLVVGLFRSVARGEFGADLLAGISIVTSVVLGEYLAGTLVVLMLSGGQALEAYAVRKASAVLAALAGRMPSVAHRKDGGAVADVPLDAVAVGDALVVFPHEICPADGTVLEGHGSMNEAYLTGEPYEVSKTPGAAVLSGAVNGASALTVRVDHLPTDSRYAKIMRVMQDAEQKRPRLRRLGDHLGAIYTPVAVAVALAAWAISGDPLRFLAVLVVATPCPLLIAIPVALIGAVSLAARRAIIIKDPAVLEKIGTCRVAIFDKTGTLTYGKPSLAELVVGDGFERGDVLTLVASLERYSKHPLAGAVLDAAVAAKLKTLDASEVGEKPGQGLTGVIGGRRVRARAAANSRARILKWSPLSRRKSAAWSASSWSMTDWRAHSGSATSPVPRASRSSGTWAGSTSSTGCSSSPGTASPRRTIWPHRWASRRSSRARRRSRSWRSSAGRRRPRTPCSWETGSTTPRP